MSNEKQEKQEEVKPQQPKMRQVILETNGNDIRIALNETAGNLELIALLSTILQKLQNTSSTR